VLLACEPRWEPHAAIERDGIAVVYKPAFWTVTTTSSMKEEAKIQSKSPRLQNWLRENLGERYPFVATNPRAGLVHRLDVQTSGPILIATNENAMEEMRFNLRKHKWYKEYIALMHGAVPPKRACGRLEYKLFTKQDRGQGWWTEVNNKKGEIAITDYQAVEAYIGRDLETTKTQRYTLVRVQIMTGRTHQIRVHLQELARELGFQIRGIVGDYKYLPAFQVKADKRLCQRVFLHAHQLHFPPPKRARGPPLFKVSCALPAELSRALDRLELDVRTTEMFREHARKSDNALPELETPGGERGGERSEQHWESSGRSQEASTVKQSPWRAPSTEHNSILDAIKGLKGLAGGEGRSSGGGSASTHARRGALTRRRFQA
jgi:23S rRNA-/tRNA-specific pseudouridylate synthase